MEKDYFIDRITPEAFGNQLSVKYIERNKAVLDWREISCKYKLPEKFIRKFQKEVDWLHISAYQVLSEEFIIEFKHKLVLRVVSSSQVLSEEFIRKNIAILSLRNICESQKISEQFVLDFSDKINFVSLIHNKQLFTYSKDIQNKVLIEFINVLQTSKYARDFHKTIEHINKKENFTPYMKERFAKLHSFI